MKKYVLLILFLINSLYCTAPLGIRDSLSIYTEEKKYNDLYNQIVESIKTFEGLSLTKYRCPAGFYTVGYGHMYQPGDNINDTISIEIADSLLLYDLETNIRAVEALTGYDRYKVPEKVLALAHFVYNIGSGNFANSTVLHNLKNDLPVENEIRRWVWIKQYVSLQLINRRNYEIAIFKESV